MMTVGTVREFNKRQARLLAFQKFAEQIGDCDIDVVSG